MSDIFSSPEFEKAYTYDGDDLGAVWSREETRFRLWAPGADSAAVCLYRSGTPCADDRIAIIPMQPSRNGTWTAELPGDLNGVYYTYTVTRGTETAEACDPYARTTGINGARAMVIDLDATNPVGWSDDRDPHAGLPFPDAVIYEAHIRDLTADESSGVRCKGKFLGLAEQGTHTPGGAPTVLSHIRALGVTHLHLLPIFDFGSVDEAAPPGSQYNWGYDPVNFNVPEGSYATDPADGAVRVRELKQMVGALHDAGISVIMDVVYNHVYSADTFCLNRLVPHYFSRVTNGVFSNGSGCGNDTATERSMVRKYIVDSVCYWAREYHIDGFRFDLAGLLDTGAVNAIVARVRELRPGVLFYGEGWQLPTVPTKPCTLATQENAALTPGFAYFNDSIRDCLRGSVFTLGAPGFVTGATGIGDRLEACFRGLPGWCTDPAQTVNYVSCHDNNTLFDRITLAAPNRPLADRIRMNHLAAAFCILSQGVPFLQAGEELLRSKPDGHGGYIANSYCAPDSVNAIKWSLLDEQLYQKAARYYAGLIALRRAHPALRMRTLFDILSNLLPVVCTHPNIGAFLLRGDAPGETADALYIIFSAANTAEVLPLPAGDWELCVDGDRAGTEPLAVCCGSVTVPPISAMVLVRR